jgi:hypothetical protein
MNPRLAANLIHSPGKLAGVWAALAACAALAAPTPAPAHATPFEIAAEPTPRGELDERVFARLRALDIRPARPCSDEVFLRRAYLDVIGLLPTAAEARRFLARHDPNKRAALVDELLARPEFGDYWGLKWGDLLRVKSEFPINLWPNSVQAYDQWIRAAMRDHVPYDRFARALLTASGSNFRVPPANFYRAAQRKDPRTLAQMAALTFMGARLETWPADRADGFARFFARVGYKPTGEWKEEIVFHDAFKTNAPDSATLPDGTVVPLTPDRDPRETFADWLLAPGNPWFARAICNRVWSWLLGRGLIHEPDDIRPDNPPSHPDVLEHLERELVAARYDLRRLYRLILNSQTYQLSSVPRSQAPQAAALAAHYPLRRLDAEVLADVLGQITGTSESYSSPIPEPFTFIPDSHRTAQLPDGSITSAFLETFGRPARDTGLESERINRVTADQCLHLLNSSHIGRKLERATRLRGPLQTAPTSELLDTLYLTVLSRRPTAAERAAVAEYERSGVTTNRPGLALDVTWALVNGSEFLFRH